MQGAITPHAEILADFNQRKQIVDKSAHDEREDRRKNRRANAPSTRRALKGGEQLDDLKQLWQTLEIPDYDLHTNKVTKFFSTADPLSYMACLVEKLENEEVANKISSNELKITFDTMLKPVPEEEDSDEEEKKDEDDDDEESTPVKCVVRFFKC